MASMDFARIGQRVRARRMELGIKSQSELAARAGLHRNTVQHLESGGDVCLSNLGLVAKALECPAADLIREDGE